MTVQCEFYFVDSGETCSEPSVGRHLGREVCKRHAEAAGRARVASSRTGSAYARSLRSYRRI